MSQESSPVCDREVTSNRHVCPVLLGVLLLVGVLAWHVPYRHLVLLGDDVFNPSYGHHEPYGRIPMDALARSVWNDLTVVNGRLADGLVRIMLSWGVGPLTWVLPLCWALLAFIVVDLLRPRRTAVAVATACVALALPALLGLAWTELNGAVLYWVSGLVNYAVAIGAALWVLARVLHAAGEIRRGTIVLAILVVLAVQLQEQASLAAVGGVVALIVSQRRLPQGSQLLLAVAAIVGGLGHLLMPGIWRRNAGITTPWSTRVAMGFQLVGQTCVGTLIVVLAIHLAVHAARRDKVTGAIAAGGLLVAGAGALLVVRAPVMAGALVTVAALILLGSYVRRGQVGSAALAAMACGAAALPLLMGLTGRAWFPTMCCVALAGLAELAQFADSLPQRAARGLAAGLLVCSLAAGCLYLWVALPPLRANARVARATARQLESARPGDRVVLRRLPSVLWSYAAAYHPRYDQYYRQFYAVAPGVVIEHGR